MIDRLPGHPVLFVDLVVIIAMMITVPLYADLWFLTAALTVMGVGKGMIDVGGNTLLVWVHRDQVGPFMSGLHFIFGVGSFLSPIIIAQMVEFSGDITWAYWTLAILIVPVAAWLILQPSPAQPAEKPDGGQKIGSGPTTSDPKKGLGGGGMLIPLIMMFFFLYVGAEVSFGGWIFTYTVTSGLSAEGQAAYLTSAFWGGLTAGRLLSIPLAVRFKPRLVLPVDLIGCLLFTGVMLLWPDQLVVVWVGAIGLGVSMASIFPTMLSLAERQLKITGQVTGWFFVGASAGAMFLPWLIGQLFDSQGPGTLIYAVVIDLVLALVVLAMILAITRLKTEPAGIER